MVLFRKRKRERCANGKTDLVLLFPGFAALARWVASRKAKTEARQVSRQEAQCFSTWRFKGGAECDSKAVLRPDHFLVTFCVAESRWFY